MLIARCQNISTTFVNSTRAARLLIIEKNLKYAQSFPISAILKMWCSCCCYCSWPLCLSAMHHYHHIALNYNELTRTPLTLFHQCFPVERRHLRHYSNCSFTHFVFLITILVRDFRIIISVAIIFDHKTSFQIIALLLF